MPALKDEKLELSCQERAKEGATDISAFKAAGYPVRDPGKAVEKITRILKNKEVYERIAEIHVEAALSNGGMMQRTMRQLAGIAFADIGKVLEWGGTIVRSHVDKATGERRVVIANQNWLRLVGSAKVDASVFAAIEEISLKADGSVNAVKLRSPTPALVALGKQLGDAPGTKEHLKFAKRDALHEHRMELMRKNIYKGPSMSSEEWQEMVNRRRAGEAAVKQAAEAAAKL